MFKIKLVLPSSIRKRIERCPNPRRKSFAGAPTGGGVAGGETVERDVLAGEVDETDGVGTGVAED